MNSNHPLFLNFMALYLCICKEYTPAKAISLMKIPVDGEIELETSQINR